MFLGHYGLAFALKRAEPKVSLGTLFLAAQLADLLWGCFLLLGWEHVRIIPEAIGRTPFDFYDYPLSHSLLAGLLWGVGMAAIQLAHAFGAITITTVGSDDKAAFCRTMGADHAINYRQQDFAAEVAAITGKRGADVILDIVGGDYIEKNLKCLALEGRLAIIAFLQGSKVTVDWRHIMMKRLTVTGSTLRASPAARKAALARSMRDKVWPLFAEGKLKPVIHRVFPLADAADAHRLMESSAHIGKIMLAVRP